MEILSDATFRGDVAIEKSLLLGKSGTSSYIGGNLIIGCTQLSPAIGHASGNVTFYNGADFNGGVTVNDIRFYGDFSICSDSSTIKVRSASITFPSTSGTLALTSDIPPVPSMAGVAHFCSIQINFDVAADCTRFYVGRTPNLPYGPASLQMFTDRLPNGGTGYYLKNVDLGVEKIDMGNPYIFVEKSSSFAISASDGYSVRIVY